MAIAGKFISTIKTSGCLVLMEYFKDFKQLQDAVTCSKSCTAELLNKDHVTQFSKSCPVHPQRQRGLFCHQCTMEVCNDCTYTNHVDHRCTESSTVIYEEIRKVGNVEADTGELLEEMKQEIYRLKEVKQTVRIRRDRNISVTKEVFATLRKSVDEREEQIIADLEVQGNKREKALELQLERMMLLWSQLKNCLQLMKKTREEGSGKVVDLINKRKILEQRRDHLRVMKKGSMLEPAREEQEEIMLEGMEQLHQEVNKLKAVPMDHSKCEAATPMLIVNKKATLTIRLSDINDDGLLSQPAGLNDTFIELKEVGHGIFELLFTPSKCSNHMISILANGRHILGSPYTIPVDRDYCKITDQDCSEVVARYGENKFGHLNDVTTGPNNEIIIADNGNRCVIVLDCNFNVLTVIGLGDFDSKLVKPVGVAVAENVIAVCDQYLCQVKKYSLQGELLSVIGCTGMGSSQFFNPKGLAFNGNKFLHVLDGGNHRVQVFQPDGAFSFMFGNEGLGPGQFQFPGRIAIDPSNNILVSDNFSNCIHLFNCSGRFINKIDCYRPWAIAVSPTGYIITVDDDIITIWSPTHHLIHQFGKIGLQQGEFIGIRGMAIGSTGDIYVVEGYNKRLQVITK